MQHSSHMRSIFTRMLMMGCAWAEEQLVIQPELLISLFNQAKTEDLRMNPSTSHSLHG